jgi:hypothetical protein
MHPDDRSIKLRSSAASPPLTVKRRASKPKQAAEAEVVAVAPPPPPATKTGTKKRRKRKPKTILPALDGPPRRITLKIRARSLQVPDGVAILTGDWWGCPFMIEPQPEKKRFKLLWKRRGLGRYRPRPRWFKFDKFPERYAAQVAIQAYFERWLLEPDQADLLAEIQSKLRGRILGCRCSPQSACHGDVLLKIANQELPHEDQSATRSDRAEQAQAM